ncbi:MAG: hypothetical protein QOJ51_1524 [Acidobacteriaceae bacterium]|nr:hypothetical protein [Acidobacteriaceae bacterium]
MELPPTPACLPHKAMYRLNEYDRLHRAQPNALDRGTKYHRKYHQKTQRT